MIENRAKKIGSTDRPTERSRDSGVCTKKFFAYKKRERYKSNIYRNNVNHFPNCLKNINS